MTGLSPKVHAFKSAAANAHLWRLIKPLGLLVGITLIATGEVSTGLGATGGSSAIAHDHTKQSHTEQSHIEHTAPTPENIVAEINRVRSSPAAYANWLESLRPYYQGAALRIPGERGVRTVEGVAALDMAINSLQSAQPLPPVTLASGLHAATQAHLDELLTHNRFTLTGLDGSTPIERAERYGDIGTGRLVESLNQGFASTEAIVAFLLIDDGDAQRAARTLILSPNVTYIGTACGSTDNQAPLCVFDYATQYQSNSGTLSEASTAASLPVGAASEQAANSYEPVEAVSAETATDIATETATETSSELTWSGPVSTEQLDTLSNELIEEINLLRANPAAYAQGLIRLRPHYEGNLVSVPGQPIVEVQEGVVALDEAISILQTAHPLSALSASTGMSLGAADHSHDLGSRGITGHYGSDNSDPFERINRYGSWSQSAGENITYGALTSAQWHVIQLLVDDGVPDRGHREILLNPDHRRIGAACSTHATYRIVCVMTHATEYQEGS